MSVNIQQADKTLKKVADTTVVNKSTVTNALGYTPVTPTELNTVKTDLISKDNNLQQQINALEGSAFDGDYNKLTNAPILNDADGTATFADEAGNIIARIDNNGLETTNLNLHGDIELADEKLEIIDETGNIVLRIDDNGVETKTTNELKTKIGDVDAQAKANASTISNIQEDLEIFNFGDTGGLTIADEQGNIIAKFDVETDAEGKVIETGLITTDVTFECKENETKTLTALNAEVAANTGAIEKNTRSIGDNANAIDTKAPIANPEFTGTPKAPSPIDNSSQRVATTDYVDNSVAGLQEDIADLPFEFNDDGTLTIADEQGNILAQFAVEKDAEGKIIETGLRVTDVSTNEINSLNTKIGDIDAALSVRYTKSEVYNKTETDTAISTAVVNAEHLKRIIVNALPTAGIDKHAIYMVKAEEVEESDQDIYDEYMYINNAWERLGSWQTDLTDYAKKVFKTITVGTVNVEADSNADTLTFVAGDNVTLTASAENDTITITSSYVDTGATDIDTSGNGNAVTGASYDTTSRKITLNKGKTFATKEEYDGFVNEFNDNFNFTNENGAFEIVDDPEETGSDTQNILARFDSEGLRVTTVILGSTNDETLIDLMNIDYNNLLAFNVNEIVDGENLPVNLANDELLLTDSEGDYIVVEKGE